MTATQAVVHDAKAEPGIHLYVGEATGGGAVVPFRWCVCGELFERMKAAGAQKPHLLLVVANRNKEVSRKLLPLDQAMEFVTFYKPGEHKIFANVVWEPSGNVGRMKKILLGVRQNNTYLYEVLNYDLEREEATLFSSFPELYNEGPKEPLLTVDVAPEFFAKKPPEWLRRWVNWWFETPLKDQCHLRKRCILAFSIQPPLALIWFIGLFLVRLVIALFLFAFLGWRGINFKAVFLLRKYCTEKIWEEGNAKYRSMGKASFFTKDKNGKDQPAFVFALSLFLPATFFLLLAIVKLAKGSVVSGVSWLEIGILALIAWLAIVGISAVGHFIWKPIAKKREAARLAEASDPTARERDRWAERARREAERRARDAEFDEQYKETVCPGVPLEASINALPQSRRTFHLRFTALKGQVCKPFAH